MMTGTVLAGDADASTPWAGNRHDRDRSHFSLATSLHFSKPSLRQKIWGD